MSRDDRAIIATCRLLQTYSSIDTLARVFRSNVLPSMRIILASCPRNRSAVVFMKYVEWPKWLVFYQHYFISLTNIGYGQFTLSVP